MLEYSQELETLFLDKVLELLIKGKNREVVKSRKMRKLKYAVDETGAYILIGKEETIQEDKEVHEEGIPQHIMEMVFNTLSPEMAIKLLESKGYLVVDPTATTIRTDQGISDNTVNLIRAKILGVEE